MSILDNDPELAAALRATKRCYQKRHPEWQLPEGERRAPVSHPVPTIQEVRVLSAMLAAPGVSPLRIAHRLRLGSGDLHDFVDSVDDLRAFGMIQAPADTGADLWTVTDAGRSYLGSRRSLIIDALLAT